MTDDEKAKIKAELDALKKRIENRGNNPEDFAGLGDDELKIIQHLKYITVRNQDYDGADKLRELEKHATERMKMKWTVELLSKITPEA